MNEEGREELSFGRARRPVRLSAETLVETSDLDGAGGPPLVVSPRQEGVSLERWAAGRREWVERELLQHGALLFRGFGVSDVARFGEFIAATSDGGALEYQERSSPRSAVGANIYTSTDYPPARAIFMHNEQSYNLTFPRKIYFCCLKPAASGGATPVADTRKVFESVSPAVRRRFDERGYTYVRNFGDGFGLPWQEAFQTTSHAEVESYCHANGIEAEWKGGGRLRTRQVRRTAARHPRTGEWVWFNHATFFHVSTLDEDVSRRLLAEFGEDDLPNNTAYGDGSPIEPEVLDELRAAYLRHKVAFKWQAGDVLMLDNMLAAHGREPFEGERRVVAGMADPCHWDRLA